MTEKVLTDEEKSALLDGVHSGEIEVQSSTGPTYASVTEFKIGPRARITKNSYPRLQLLNQQVAGILSKSVGLLLQSDVGVTAGDLSVGSINECCEQHTDPSVVIIFEAAPLHGKGVIALQSALIRHLVDAFFGGDGNESERATSHAFTLGEMSVCNLFADVVLTAFKDVWAPILEFSPERTGIDVNIDLVDIGAETGSVIGSEFEVSFPEQHGLFQVLWPVDMLGPLIPAFNGQKKDRDPADDLRWEKAIRRGVADSVVRLTSIVGHVQMNLGELINLTPGDVIEIDDPHHATVLAKQVPLLHGRLGAHRGRNAIETVKWLDAQQEI